MTEEDFGPATKRWCDGGTLLEGIVATIITLPSQDLVPLSCPAPRDPQRSHLLERKVLEMFVNVVAGLIETDIILGPAWALG